MEIDSKSLLIGQLIGIMCMGSSMLLRQLCVDYNYKKMEPNHISPNKVQAIDQDNNGKYESTLKVNGKEYFLMFDKDSIPIISQSSSKLDSL